MRKHLLSVALLVLALLLPVLAPAADRDPPSLVGVTVSELQPTIKHGRAERAIAGLLSQYHYRQGRIDDALSASIFDAYLDSLDPNRSYLLADDVEDFARHRHALDDALRTGELGAAFEMFNRYQHRALERTLRIQDQLAESVDFTVDESLDLEREDSPWATHPSQLDEIWRKRLKYELLNLVLAGQDLASARDTLMRRYEGRLRRTLQSTVEDVFQVYMNAVSQTFDPHTAYLSPRTSENFNIQMRLSLEGIGAVLRMEDEHTTIVELVPGGPADLSRQLKPNDRVMAVGQGEDGPLVDVVGWRLDDVVDLIRGPRDSVVRLRVLPADGGADAVARVVRLVRNRIQLEEQAARSEIKTVSLGGHGYRIGIITVPTFYIDFAAAQRGESDYRSTTRDVRRLVRALDRDGVDGLIVDVRQNGGGSLQEAVELTGLFIDQGPVVQVRNSRGNVEVERDPEPGVVYDGPMAVLVNRFSASASEIFAGAMQDYGRAVVIGESTFGKGTVQTLVDLNRYLPRVPDALGQLKLTVAKFYRVNGSSTQHRGVVPDIAFPSVFSPDEVGESAQSNALPWDEILPARYRIRADLPAVLPEVLARHHARLERDAAFRRFLDAIEHAREQRIQTTVSLLKSQRAEEQARSQARQREYLNLRRAALGLAPLDPDDEVAASDEESDGDPVLEESVRVVADLADLMGGGTVVRSDTVVPAAPSVVMTRSE